jgi:hypothetical protein
MAEGDRAEAALMGLLNDCGGEKSLADGASFEDEQLVKVRITPARAIERNPVERRKCERT